MGASAECRVCSAERLNAESEVLSDVRWALRRAALCEDTNP